MANKNYQAIFTVDSWHSNTSKDLVSVVEGEKIESSIKLIEYFIKKRKDIKPLSDYDKKMLSDIGQTQGREVNFIITKGTFGHLIS